VLCDLALQVNVVVMRGQNDDEVLDFVEMTRDVPINIRFIEYMPFDGNVWSNNKMVPYAELAERINGRYFPGLQRLQASGSLGAAVAMLQPSSSN
jgi:cyclic pyranopterin phosphate synthase